MGGWLLREPRIRGASLRCGRPRSVRAAQAEIRKGEILGPGEEGSQISTGQVCAQERSAAKADPAQVERTGICSAERFARVQCPAKSRHHYPLRLTVIQRHIAAYMFNSTKQRLLHCTRGTRSQSVWRWTRGANLLYVASAVSRLRLNTGLTASPPISLPIIHQQLLSFRNVSQH